MLHHTYSCDKVLLQQVIVTYILTTIFAATQLKAASSGLALVDPGMDPSPLAPDGISVGVGGHGVGSGVNSGGLEPQCLPLNDRTFYCNINGYSTVQPFNNSLGHTSLQAAIAELHKFTYLLAREPCKSKIHLFLCSLYVPICVKSYKTLLPCRDDCEEARLHCSPDLAEIRISSWPEEWNCEKFNYYKDDSLCVINNTRESQLTSSASLQAENGGGQNGGGSSVTDSKLTATDNEEPVDLATESQHTNTTVCESGFFDCKLRDPSKGRVALCIEQTLVCDGRRDCVIANPFSDGVVITEGLDEEGCEAKCNEGQHYCDGKCIDRSDICNGKVDCSSGSDEKECYDYFTGLVQLILCIFALCSALCLLIRYFKFDPEEKEYTISNHLTISNNCDTLERPTNMTNSSIPDELTNSMNDPRISPNRHQSIEVIDEPVYSIQYENYERLNIGGYSGASSVYASTFYACPEELKMHPDELLEDRANHYLNDHSKKPTRVAPPHPHPPAPPSTPPGPPSTPPAPPPTPAPQDTYS